MYVSDEWVSRMMLVARVEHSQPITLQLTAGWGCTVMEIFERDEPKPQVPLERVLLGA